MDEKVVPPNCPGPAGGGRKNTPFRKMLNELKKPNVSKFAAEGERVGAAEQGKVVGELPDVLVQDVVNRERLMAQRWYR